MLIAYHAVHSSTLMDHVLLLVLLTIQPVVIPTTLVVCKPVHMHLCYSLFSPFQNALSLVYLVMNQTQVVVDVFQFTYV